MSDKKQDRFADNFLGEEVQFFVKAIQKVVEETEHGTLVQETPMAIQGFILDIDEKNVYLGETPNEITRWVAKDQIIGGDIVKIKSVFDEVLDNLPTDGQGN